MTIKLLMGAGSGSRFEGAGFNVPKPFVSVGGKPMFLHVAEKLGSMTLNASSGITFVTKHSHKKYVDRFPRGRAIENVKYVPDMTAAGPAWSVVAATLARDPFEDLLIMDCDCYVDPGEGQYKPLWQIARGKIERHTQAVVFGNPDNYDMWAAAIKSDRDGKVYIKEGGVEPSDLTNIGIYWFRTLGHFRRVTDLASEVCGTQEVKISHVVNLMNNWEVETQVIQGKFWNLGTPERLKLYMEEKLNGPTIRTL